MQDCFLNNTSAKRCVAQLKESSPVSSSCVCPPCNPKVDQKLPGYKPLYYVMSSDYKNIVGTFDNLRNLGVLRLPVSLASLSKISCSRIANLVPSERKLVLNLLAVAQKMSTNKLHGEKVLVDGQIFITVVDPETIKQPGIDIVPLCPAPLSEYSITNKTCSKQAKGVTKIQRLEMCLAAKIATMPVKSLKPVKKDMSQVSVIWYYTYSFNKAIYCAELRDSKLNFLWALFPKYPINVEEISPANDFLSKKEDPSELTEDIKKLKTDSYYRVVDSNELIDLVLSPVGKVEPKEPLAPKTIAEALAGSKTRSSSLPPDPSIYRNMPPQEEKLQFAPPSQEKLQFGPSTQEKLQFGPGMQGPLQFGSLAETVPVELPQVQAAPRSESLVQAPPRSESLVQATKVRTQTVQVQPVPAQPVPAQPQPVIQPVPAQPSFTPKSPWQCSIHGGLWLDLDQRCEKKCAESGQIYFPLRPDLAPNCQLATEAKTHIILDINKITNDLVQNYITKFPTDQPEPKWVEKYVLISERGEAVYLIPNWKVQNVLDYQLQLYRRIPRTIISILTWENKIYVATDKDNNQLVLKYPIEIPTYFKENTKIAVQNRLGVVDIHAKFVTQYPLFGTGNDQDKEFTANEVAIEHDIRNTLVPSTKQITTPLVPQPVLGGVRGWLESKFPKWFGTAKLRSSSAEEESAPPSADVSLVSEVNVISPNPAQYKFEPPKKYEVKRQLKTESLVNYKLPLSREDVLKLWADEAYNKQSDIQARKNGTCPADKQGILRFDPVADKEYNEFCYKANANQEPEDTDILQSVCSAYRGDNRVPVKIDGQYYCVPQKCEKRTTTIENGQYKCEPPSVMQLLAQNPTVT